MTVKSVVVALGLLASAGFAACAQSKSTDKPASTATSQPANTTPSQPASTATSQPANAAASQLASATPDKPASTTPSKSTETTTKPAATTTKPEATKPAATKPAATPAPAPANLHFTVAPQGNEARYVVREQLVGIDFPSDAIGKAHDITGMIVVKPDGTLLPDSSRITVNVQTMKSDKSQRDKSIRTQAIETDNYPTVSFVPTSFAGLTARPGATDAAFTVTGNLTVHGATHPVTWDVKAHSAGTDVLGSASTKFVFEDFGMKQPKKAIVLTVMDTVKLEYDFHFVQVPPQ